MSEKENTIIGAGPIGTYLAWQLAKNKKETTIIEEHKIIGKPVQCTGIITKEIEKYIPKKLIKEVTKNKVTRTIIHAGREKTEIPISTNYIIDNAEYCQKLADKALREGAKIITQQKYLSNNKEKIIIKDLRTKEKKEIRTKYLIGADGPRSSVASNNGLMKNRKFLIGIQAIIRMNKKDYKEEIHFYPSIGEYAWYAPEGEGRARIGIASRNNAKKIFEEFIKKFPGKKEEMQGGIIPLHNPIARISKKQARIRVQLAGDAAGIIKNTTGGGIVPGTKAAHQQAKNQEKYSLINIIGVKKELMAHYIINKAMKKFNEKDWEKLLRQSNDERIKKILRENNRDEADKIALKILTQKPEMILWGRKLL